MGTLQDDYSEMINPIWIRQNIQTDEQFKEWLKIETVEDLQEDLKVFEQAEMYEDCKMILKEIKRKTKPS